MAAFVCEDPKDKVAFDAHWDKILRSSQNITRTIVAEGQVAGHTMKPTAPDQVNVSNLATNPAGGLSLSRSAKRCLGVLA